MLHSVVTRTWHVDPEQLLAETLRPAIAALQAGGVVAFPTETVYGLGADALNPQAVHRIFHAKGRPADNPLIVHVSSLEMATELLAEKAEIGVLEQLAAAFWPGPLTVVVSRNERLDDIVTAGLNTVGLRIPAHPVALQLIRMLERPIAAPSANRSGRPSPTQAAHVMADLGGRIEGIIDGGSATVGLESTVLDITEWPPVLLRPGGVTPEDLSGVLGTQVTIDGNVHAARADLVHQAQPVRSPGMKYVHYAPSTPLLLVERPTDTDSLTRIALEQQAMGKKVALLLTDETADLSLPFPTLRLGSRLQPDQIAAGLFAALRDVDRGGYDLVIVEGIEASGVGLAVMNRLRRAASALSGDK